MDKDISFAGFTVTSKKKKNKHIKVNPKCDSGLKH